MTSDFDTNVRASRVRVARSRGALSGVLLLILGAWAAIVPFIGPYLEFAFTPRPNSTWYWTAARGWFEVAPGAAAIVGGLLLLGSANRVTALFGGWLAAVGGTWLVVGPALASIINTSPGDLADIGNPDPSSSSTVQALEGLFFYWAIGAAILFVAAMALGRLSVQSLRDIRAAERRAEAAAAAEEARLAEERRVAEERRISDERRMDEERRIAAERGTAPPASGEGGYAGPPGGRHDAMTGEGSPAGTRGYAPAESEGQPTQAMPQYPPPERRP